MPPREKSKKLPAERGASRRSSKAMQQLLISRYYDIYQPLFSELRARHTGQLPAKIDAPTILEPDASTGPWRKKALRKIDSAIARLNDMKAANGDEMASGLENSGNNQLGMGPDSSTNNQTSFSTPQAYTRFISHRTTPSHDNVGLDPMTPPRTTPSRMMSSSPHDQPLQQTAYLHRSMGLGLMTPSSSRLPAQTSSPTSYPGFSYGLPGQDVRSYGSFNPDYTPGQPTSTSGIGNMWHMPSHDQQQQQQRLGNTHAGFDLGLDPGPFKAPSPTPNHGMSMSGSFAHHRSGQSGFEFELGGQVPQGSGYAPRTTQASSDSFTINVGSNAALNNNGGLNGNAGIDAESSWTDVDLSNLDFNGNNAASFSWPS